MRKQIEKSKENLKARTFQKTVKARKYARIFAYLILTFWAVLSLLPIYFMFIMSFQEIGISLTIRDIQFIPTAPSLENFVGLFQLDAPFWVEKRPIFRWFLNSALVATIPTISNLIFDSMAGYSLAKLKFPGRRFIFLSIIATMMIPSFVTFIPLYRMMFEFKWMDTYWALLFPGFAGVGGIFLMKQNIQTLPKSILDAARIDACSEF
ncbi:MAG: carbohydrate ABC transporter permease, partial [Halanaerobiales bacterium]